MKANASFASQCRVSAGDRPRRTPPARRARRRSSRASPPPRRSDGSWRRPGSSSARRCRCSRPPRPRSRPGARDGPLERVEVHADQVDRLDSLAPRASPVCSGSSRTASSAGVEARVQRLHPPVEDLGRAGEVGDVADLQARLAQRAPPCRPVETSSIPSSARPRAKSTTPVLSETEISARRTATGRASPASSAPVGLASRALPSWRERVYWPSAASSPSGAMRTRRGLSRSTSTRPAAIIRIASGSSACSVAWIASSSASRSRLGRDGHRPLEDDRTRVDTLVDEVDGHPGDPDPVRERLPDRVEARETRAAAPGGR